MNPVPSVGEHIHRYELGVYTMRARCVICGKEARYIKALYKLNEYRRNYGYQEKV